jgi:gliding motility-associated-like protein
VCCLAQKGWAQTNQTVPNGSMIALASFPSTGCVYIWTNSNPAIGLPANGVGDIAGFRAINTGNTAITATITATPVPSGMAYITNSGSNDVSVVSTVTKTVIATIPVGAKPYGVSVSKDGSRVYIGNINSNNVSVIDAISNTVIATIPVGKAPTGVVVSPDGKKVYVTCETDNVVSVINTDTNTVEATIPAGQRPYGITTNKAGTRVYVTNITSKSISVIDMATNTVFTTIPYGYEARDIEVSPDDQFVYVLAFGGVIKIDAQTNTVVNRNTNVYGADVGVISKDGVFLYYSDRGYLGFILLNSGFTFAASGSSIKGMDLTPDDKTLFFTVSSNNVLGYSDNIVSSQSGFVTVGSDPAAYGNFIAQGLRCTGSPVTFTIQVNPSPALQVSSAMGTIAACEGSASIAPNIQQFTLSGNSLTANVNVAAPPGFEVSLNTNSGYSSSISVSPTAGTLGNTTIYVRSAATASAGAINGNVVCSSAGVLNQQVAVTGTITPIPTINAIPLQSLPAGTATAVINFSGTASTYNWTNNNPAIGLPASGSGNIPSFTARNNTGSAITATITVTPVSGACMGTPAVFTITVNPVTFIATTGTINPLNTVYGSPSSPESFTLTGKNLSAAIVATAPNGFELSINNSTFSPTLTLNPVNGDVNTVVYVRLRSTADAGNNYSGNIVLSSTGANSINMAIPNSTIDAASLTITANDISKTYGTALQDASSSSAFRITSGSLKNGNTLNQISIAYGTGKSANDRVGSYATVTPTVTTGGGNFVVSNYAITPAPGNINVTPVSLTIKADNKKKLVDAPNPTLTASYTGFVNSENASVLTALPVLSTTATLTSGAGDYPITATGAQADNYTINYESGVLTVSAVPTLVVVPNTFTPNGDGINDVWDIPALSAYPENRVTIYNRMGGAVFQSNGYSVSWDGRSKGAQLPYGTYYYVINLGTNAKPLAGYITLIR